MSHMRPARRPPRRLGETRRAGDGNAAAASLNHLPEHLQADCDYAARNAGSCKACREGRRIYRLQNASTAFILRRFSVVTYTVVVASEA